MLHFLVGDMPWLDIKPNYYTTLAQKIQLATSICHGELLHKWLSSNPRNPLSGVALAHEWKPKELMAIITINEDGFTLFNKESVSLTLLNLSNTFPLLWKIGPSKQQSFRSLNHHFGSVMIPLRALKSKSLSVFLNTIEMNMSSKKK